MAEQTFLLETSVQRWYCRDHGSRSTAHLDRYVSCLWLNFALHSGEKNPFFSEYLFDVIEFEHAGRSL